MVQITMTIDIKLMRKAIKYCGTRHRLETRMNRGIISQFEEKYLHFASTTEEAAGLAVLLNRMTYWYAMGMLFGGKSRCRGDTEGLVRQESYPIARDICEYLVRPTYEDCSLKGTLIGMWRGLPFDCFYPFKDGAGFEYVKKEGELDRKLQELYFKVVDSMNTTSKQREK